MPISFSELQLAFEFVSSGGMGENEAYLDRQSGKIYWHSEFGYNDEELPDDIDDEKYIAIPDKIELDGLARFRSRFPTPRQDPGNRVRTRRAAGGNRIRTASPAHAKGSAAQPIRTPARQAQAWKVRSGRRWSRPALTTAVLFAMGPQVRIRFPPAASPQTLGPSVISERP
jgi:hypothetical protein